MCALHSRCSLTNQLLIAMNTFLSQVLTSPAFVIGARVVLTLLFWSAGLFGIFHFDAIVEEMRTESLPAPEAFAVLTIAVQLIGSILTITNFKGLGWLGAGMLATFTVLTIPFGHAFWKFQEPRRTAELHLVLEHLTVVGGLLVAAVLMATQDNE